MNLTYKDTPLLDIIHSKTISSVCEGHLISMTFPPRNWEGNYANNHSSFIQRHWSSKLNCLFKCIMSSFLIFDNHTQFDFFNSFKDVTMQHINLLRDGCQR
jgi:hypothetical protein